MLYSFHNPETPNYKQHILNPTSTSAQVAEEVRPLLLRLGAIQAKLGVRGLATWKGHGDSVSGLVGKTKVTI